MPNLTLWPEKTWSHEELLKLFPGAKVLKDVISGTTQWARRESSVVCEICVNGIVLSESDEDKFSASSIDEIETVRVKVEKVQTLLDESLVGCKEYLSRLTHSIEHAALLFRADDLVAAHKFYRTCIEGAQLFIDMITHYKIVFQSTRGDLPVSWKTQETLMIATLSQVLEAYKKKNYILVADLLEYDLINLLVRWQNELSQLDRNQPIEINVFAGPDAEVETESSAC